MTSFCRKMSLFFPGFFDAKATDGLNGKTHDAPQRSKLHFAMMTAIPNVVADPFLSALEQWFPNSENWEGSKGASRRGP